MTAVERMSSEAPTQANQSVFGDVELLAAQAIDEAVAERRRLGLPIAVDRGRGVELIP